MDIRDKAFIDHNDVISLNFINKNSPYQFRRHSRQGLRSHIMEILRTEDIRKETFGVIKNNIRWYPKAQPVNMLRIFRKKFDSMEPVMREIKRFKILEKYLPKGSYAGSNEFIVDYFVAGKYDMLLCGMQEYVKGEDIDPWALPEREYLVETTCVPASQPGMCKQEIGNQLIKQSKAFINGLKKMGEQAGYLPDLAGMGNILLTPHGNLKLVDINNISKLRWDNKIYLDDKGYPVCDKSVEALWLLEKRLLKRENPGWCKMYSVFLDKARMKEANVLVKEFEINLGDE